MCGTHQNNFDVLDVVLLSCKNQQNRCSLEAPQPSVVFYLHKSNSVLECLCFKFSLEHYFKFTASYLQSVSRYCLCISIPLHFISSDLNLLPRHQRKYWTEPTLIVISSEYCIKESAVITNLSITQLITYLLYDSILSLDCHMVLSQILYEISALFTKSIILSRLTVKSDLLDKIYIPVNHVDYQ